MTTAVWLPVGVRDLLADPAALTCWLQSLPPEAVCGVCGEPESCIVHSFLDWACVGDYISVGKYDILVGSNEVDAIQFDLPDWCRVYVAAVDAFGKGCMLNAGDALAILLSVTEALAA